MADMKNRLTCNNFEAWVSSGDKALTQYKEESETDGQKSCWIASQTDQEFYVSYLKKVKDDDDYVAEVFLDGNLVQSTIYVGSSRHKPHTKSYIRVSSTEHRAFVFGPLNLSEDDEHLENGTQNVGEIKVVIVKAKAVDPNAPKIGGAAVKAVPEAVMIHERAKVGLGHHVKYNSVVVPPEPAPERTYYLKRETFGPIATFLFKYRPLALLCANGIAPLSDLPITEAANATEVLGGSSHPLTTGTKVEPVDGEGARNATAPLAKKKRRRPVIAPAPWPTLPSPGAVRPNKLPEIASASTGATADRNGAHTANVRSKKAAQSPTVSPRVNLSPPQEVRVPNLSGSTSISRVGDGDQSANQHIDPVRGQSPIEAKVPVTEEEREHAAVLARERELLAELEQIRNAKRAMSFKDTHRSKKMKIKGKGVDFANGEIIDLT